MNQGYGRFGDLTASPVLFSQRRVGYGTYGQEEDDYSTKALDLAANIVGLLGAKSPQVLEKQLATAKARGMSAATIRKLEGQLATARASAQRSQTWHTLGQLAVVGVIGLAIAGSYALVTRATKN